MPSRTHVCVASSRRPTAQCLTSFIGHLCRWLVGNKKFQGDMSAFKRKLHEVWFGLYRREVAKDSSGFEHVFIGEVKDGQVSGFHNWIQMYLEEKAGRLDYLGYIKPKQKGLSFMAPAEQEQVITIQFAWKNEIKPVSTRYADNYNRRRTRWFDLHVIRFCHCILSVHYT
jgi:hypothetical protein